MRTPPIAILAIAPPPIFLLEMLGSGSLGGAVEKGLLLSDVEDCGTTEETSEPDGLLHGLLDGILDRSGDTAAATVWNKIAGGFCHKDKTRSSTVTIDSPGDTVVVPTIRWNGDGNCMVQVVSMVISLTRDKEYIPSSG